MATLEDSSDFSINGARFLLSHQVAGNVFEGEHLGRRGFFRKIE